MKPKVSVLVCTHNRGEQLVVTLKSLQHQTADSGAYEVLVIDNASTDATRAVVLRVIDGLPHFRYVHEAAVGLSVARNTGVRESTGEIVAFIDDDAIADRNWVSAIAGAFDDPGVWVVGGRAEPAWPHSPPRWLDRPLAGYVGVTNYGAAAMRLSFPNYPYGVNMAVRRHAFERVGGFAANLGRKGTSLLSNEEFDFCYKVEQAGGAILYEPSALVHHQIAAARLSLRWFLRRMYWQGRSQAVFDVTNLEPREVARQRSRLRRRFVKGLRRHPRGNTSGVALLCRFAHLVGYEFQQRLGRAAR